MFVVFMDAPVEISLEPLFLRSYENISENYEVQM